MLEHPAEYAALLDRPESTSAHMFIGKDEFCALLVSNRQLTRWDMPSANMRGLRDIATGEWFVIEERELFA